MVARREGWMDGGMHVHNKYRSIDSDSKLKVQGCSGKECSVSC